MGYSRRRLAVLGVLWLAVGLLVFGGTLFGGAAAEPNCPEPVAPEDYEDEAENANPADFDEDVVCSFPADAYDGGLILGTPQLAGDDLGMFIEETAEEEFDGIDEDYPRDTDNPIAMPAGASNDPFDVDIATVGFGVDVVESLFFYKTWKTQEDRQVPSGNVNEGDYDDVYVWVQTTEAQLEGPQERPEAPNSIECRNEEDKGTQGEVFNPNHCDLVAEVSEVSFNDIDFAATADASFIGETPITDDNIDEIGPNPHTGFWINRPRDDTCGLTDLFDFDALLSTSPELNIEGFCFGIIDVTFEDQDETDVVCDPTGILNCAGVNDFEIEQLILYDLLVRSHGYIAEPPDPDDPTQDKILRLGNPNAPPGTQGFYAEIRWGKGHDRAIFPPSSRAGDAEPDDFGTTLPDPEQGLIAPGQTHRFGGPAPASSDSTVRTGPDVAGVGNTFPCIGNPTDLDDDDIDDDCVRDFDNSRPSFSDARPGPFDDISEEAG